MLARNHYQQGEELSPEAREIWTAKISSLQTPSRGLIAKAMCWAVNHSYAAHHVMEILMQSVITDETIQLLAASFAERRRVVRSVNSRNAIGAMLTENIELVCAAATQRVLARFFLVHDIMMNSNAPRDARLIPANLAKSVDLLLPRLLDRVGLLVVAIGSSSNGGGTANAAAGKESFALEKGSPVAEIVGWVRHCVNVWVRSGLLEHSAQIISGSYSFLVGNGEENR
jgi:hypothetical protein